MSWYPIAFLPPQYVNSSGVPYSGAVLKAYAAGTTTPISMATSYTGATLTGSLALNAAGYPTYLGTIVIPHIAQNYKLALYPSQAAADANSGAIWTVDNIQIEETTGTPFVEYFDGDGVTTTFNLSQDLGTDERVLMVFADRPLTDYVTNGGFSSASGWTLGSGWSIGAGVATATGAISTAISQNAGTTLIQGESYTVEITITVSAGTLTASVGGNSGTARSSSGTYRETIIAGSTQALAFTGAGFTGTLDTVSVKPTSVARRQALRPNEYTLAGTALTLTFAPPTATGNVIVFAPAQLVGAANAAAASAATSETNAAANAAAAAASAAQVGSAQGWQYIYDTDTASTDPTAGKLKFNNATLASATELYISETTNAAQAIAATLNTWDDSTSTIRGSLRMFKQSTPATFALFNITGTRTDNGAWDTFTVAYVGGSGSFTDEDAVILEYVRNGDKGDTGATGSAGANGNDGLTIPGGRLTLTSGAAVTQGDVTGASTIYYTPYLHNKIRLYNGSAWADHTFTERSLALSSLTSGRPYDVFIYDNAGTLTLELEAWTSDTARNTALTTQDGILVKSGATTRRYLGTFYTTSTSTTADALSTRYLFNYYNRIEKALYAGMSGGSYTYTTATWRNRGGNTTLGKSRFGLICGVVEDRVKVINNTTSVNTTNQQQFSAVALNGTTSAEITGGYGVHALAAAASAVSQTNATPRLGWNFVQAMEYSVASGTTTWYDAGSGGVMTGNWAC